jgi:ribosomal protein L16
MLGLNLLRPTTAFASSSRLTLSAPIALNQVQSRFRSDIAPRLTKYRKAQKGRVSIPTVCPLSISSLPNLQQKQDANGQGGSIKGTTLEHGTFGIRTLGSARLTADQLTSAITAIKRKIKPVKGAEVFMRVFPDIPVCVKGNETRMGKGKGSFEYWACRVPLGRVVFEVGGGGIREEIAKQGTFMSLGVDVEDVGAGVKPMMKIIVWRR